MVERLGDGFSSSFLSQLLSGHRGIGDDVADKIEERLGLVSGYLDNDADGITAEFSWLYEHSSEEGKGFLRNSMRAVASLFLSPDGDRRKHSVPVLNDRRKSLK